MSSVRNLTSTLFVMFALLALGLGSGCGVELDKLYALPLDQPPGEADWKRAVPYRLKAVGGATSQAGDADVDDDSVHMATASCHHGTKTPPVAIAARAFYTADRLYLRFEWSDPTRDTGPSWRWRDGRWRADAQREDGLGLLWGTDPEFRCATTCHLHDWRMAGVRAVAEYGMQTPKDVSLDFWIWQAGRGSLTGMVEDGALDSKGRQGDAPGELFVANSARAKEKRSGAFGNQDVPLTTPEPAFNAVAPGYLLGDGPAGRLEVTGEAVHRDGTWRLTLSRPLTGSEPGDIVFTPGGEYPFGLAVLDGVARDHNAVRSTPRLVLVAAEPTGKASEVKE